MSSFELSASVGEEAPSAEATVLQQTVNWEALLSAGVLGDRDVQLIRRFDKRDKFTQNALWEKAREAFGEALRREPYIP